MLVELLGRGRIDAPPRKWPFLPPVGEVLREDWDPLRPGHGEPSLVAVKEVAIALRADDEGTVEVDVPRVADLDPLHLQGRFGGGGI